MKGLRFVVKVIVLILLNKILQKNVSVLESLASSAVKTARELKCPFIIVYSDSGNAARLVSKYFPSVPVLILTQNPIVARQCEGYMSNCRSKLIDMSLTNPEVLTPQIIADCLKKGLCKKGDPIISLYGQSGLQTGTTNMIKLNYA